jgi:gamma-glutamylcyclotransferase (GGCT)/AIG2-like uncharacterized protein YtfP
MESLDQQQDTVASARLFVYGTLCQGFGSHGLLQRLRARFIAPGYVFGRLYDLGEYPGALESAGNLYRVHGEVYLLPNAAEAFTVLDQYEGFNAANPTACLFERRETTVMLATGGQMQAWIYWLHRFRSPARLVPSGKYASR